MNKSSGRVAKFGVRLFHGGVSQYTYNKKSDQTPVTVKKFETWLVGSKPESYCVGYVKGSDRVVEQAQRRFTDGSVWELSKVAFDTYTGAAYISTPVPFRVDLGRSTVLARDSDKPDDRQLRDTMPRSPVPPRSVADVARFTTNRSTDLIAVVKEWSRERKDKSGESIVDVELIDNSELTQGKLATVKVSVFGTSKVGLVKLSTGEPMVFLNLSVSCADGKPQITHYKDALAQAAPECGKTASLKAKGGELAEATNTERLTSEWTPQQPRDVSGPQPLSCAAFLDFTTETPLAALPPVVQLMWVHFEEPEPDDEVLDGSGSRVWIRTPGRDASGAAQMGVPQRCALALASCASKDEFLQKHAAGGLNMPLLCHARISRNVRGPAAEGASQESTQGGASQPATYVNHNVEAVEPVSWDPLSAPNAAYNDVLSILNNCPPHDEGILFAYLEDIEPDPHYGFCIRYDGQVGARCLYAAALVASEGKGANDRVGEGFRVVTAGVKDAANPKGSSNSYTTVGYCTLDNLAGFSLDPPRGKTKRCAIVLFAKKDEEGLHVHKLEHVEPDQVENAILCVQKLRKLCRGIRPGSGQKRSHAVSLGAGECSPGTTKKARTLQASPTEQSLDGDA